MNASESVPFMGVTDAARATGLSVWFIRQGISNGSIPFIRSGSKALVNVPALLQILDEQSKRGVTHEY